jgi:hypothetical protein
VYILCVMCVWLAGQREKVKLRCWICDKSEKRYIIMFCRKEELFYEGRYLKCDSKCNCNFYHTYLMLYS